MKDGQPTDDDYRELLDIRTSLRRFLLWSQERAAEVGLAPAQHQLLLAVRGHHGEHPPTVREVAWHLLLRHHSAVQLIDRAERLGLVRRVRDADDRRVVRVSLTRAGMAKLDQLAPLHLEELARLAPRFRRLPNKSDAPARKGGDAAGRSAVRRSPRAHDAPAAAAKAVLGRPG